VAVDAVEWVIWGFWVEVLDWKLVVSSLIGVERIAGTANPTPVLTTRPSTIIAMNVSLSTFHPDLDLPIRVKIHNQFVQWWRNTDTTQYKSRLTYWGPVRDLWNEDKRNYFFTTERIAGTANPTPVLTTRPSTIIAMNVSLSTDLWNEDKRNNEPSPWYFVVDGGEGWHLNMACLADHWTNCRNSESDTRAHHKTFYHHRHERQPIHLPPIEALFVTFEMRTKETMNRLLGTLWLTEVRAGT
jgi:hypothetical protein